MDLRTIINLAVGSYASYDCVDTLPAQGYAHWVDLARAQESLKAAEVCLREGLVNSSVSRAYYAMFQAAHVALDTVGVKGAEWSHPALQAAFTTELIHRRKMFPAPFRDYLSSGLAVRHVADYGRSGVSNKIAQRLARRANAFVSAVEEITNRGSKV